jgi:hypothetical protein
MATQTEKKTVLLGIITPRLKHFLSVVLQEASCAQPYESVAEAQQDLLTMLDEEYSVIDQGGTLVVTKE